VFFEIFGDLLVQAAQESAARLGGSLGDLNDETAEEILDDLRLVAELGCLYTEVPGLLLLENDLLERCLVGAGALDLPTDPLLRHGALLDAAANPSSEWQATLLRAALRESATMQRAAIERARASAADHVAPGGLLP
jgi:hypothetical protein